MEEDIKSSHGNATTSGNSRRNKKGKEQRIHAIDQQLDSAIMFFFSNLIGQDHCVISCICFCDFMDDEAIAFLFYSVITLQ